jgi:hypothetical protein
MGMERIRHAADIYDGYHDGVKGPGKGYWIYSLVASDSQNTANELDKDYA